MAEKEKSTDIRAQAARAPETRQISAREFYTVIFVHKWTIFVAFFIMLAGILWGLSLRERLYIASVKFYVNRMLPQQAALRYIGSQEWEEEINTMAELGRSQGVLTEAGREFDVLRGWPDPPLERSQAIAAGLATMVEVLPVPSTNIINILVRDTDPDTSLMIAELYGRSFKNEFRRVSHLSQGRTFFLKAISEVEQKIEDARNAKVKLQQETGIYNWENEVIAINESNQILLRELTEKRVLRQTLEKETEFEKNFYDKDVDFVMTSSLRADDIINQLEYRIADVKLDLAELESRYTPDHRLVIAKRQELDYVLQYRKSLIEKAIKEHRQQTEEIRQGERAIEETIDGLNQRLKVIPYTAVQIAYYDAYIANQWKLYSELITKYNDTQATDEQSLLENQLVQLGPPNIGGVVGATPRVVFVVVAPIFALLLAISIAFMSEATNHTFQKTADIEEYTGLPVLATFRRL